MKEVFTILMLILITFICINAEEMGEFFKKPDEFPTYEGRSLMDMVKELEDNMDNPEFLYNYAWQAAQESDYGTAKNYIEKAVELRRQNAFLHFKAGQIYLMTGEIQNARTHFEKALENSYEYIDAWIELVSIAPEYYYNLAQLYGEKAHQHYQDNLADKATEHYQTYIDKKSNGEFVESARAGIRDMNLLKTEIASKDRISRNREFQQQEVSGRKLAQKREMQEFRTTKKHLVGLFLNTFGPSEDYVFNLREGKVSLTDSVRLKPLTSSISEFSFGAGYVAGPFMFRGSVIFGMENLKWIYTYEERITQEADTIYITQDTTIGDSTYSPGDTYYQPEIVRDLTNTVASVNTTRFTVEGIYNFYYANPLLLYASLSGDIGYIYLKENESYFESKWISGVGIGGGVMLRLGSFIFDLGYRYNVVGSSSGSILSIGGMFKF